MRRPNPRVFLAGLLALCGCEHSPRPELSGTGELVLYGQLLDWQAASPIREAGGGRAGLAHVRFICMVASAPDMPEQPMQADFDFTVASLIVGQIVLQPGRHYVWLLNYRNGSAPSLSGPGAQLPGTAATRTAVLRWAASRGYAADQACLERLPETAP